MPGCTIPQGLLKINSLPYTLFCVTLIPLIFADHFRKFCLVFPTKVRNVIIFHLRLSAFSARTNHAFSGLPAKVYGRESMFEDLGCGALHLESP